MRLGFEKLLGGDVVIFGVGDTAFILQRYYQKEWAENFMVQLMVDSEMNTLDQRVLLSHFTWRLPRLCGRLRVKFPSGPFSLGTLPRRRE
jgi:hypothetical protein